MDALKETRSGLGWVVEKGDPTYDLNLNERALAASRIT